MSAYRVLIADDHPMARKAIRIVLQTDPSFECIGEATNGEEAFKRCGELFPDLVLMDINMPGVNGLEAAKKIRQTYPEIRVVVLTVSDDAADLFTALQFGAQGYLLKNMDSDDWISYLHALLDEGAELSRDMADRLFHQFRTGKNEHEADPETLTAREREIIVHVAAGETNRQIAENLTITENTVKNHIKNILDKLTLDNRVKLTAYAIRHGLARYSKSSDVE